jgi:hypothetical protein
MSETIYYGYMDNTLGYDPESLVSHLSNNIFKRSENNPILACPAFNDYNKNVFAIKSLYQFSLEWDGSQFKTWAYDQNFYDRYLDNRSQGTGVISFKAPALAFISESDDLCITQEQAYFHDNDITRKCYTIPGTYNIGKHLLRPFELAIKFKGPGVVKINEEDALYYTRFHTTKNIIFKKFIYTPELREIVLNQLSIRNYTKGFKDLQWWYNYTKRHNLKKYCLKLIKQNLL